MLKLLIVILSFLFFGACSESVKKHDLNQTVQDYYKVYQERSELDRFLEYYDDAIVLEDIINGDKVVGKKALFDFFDWSNPNFVQLDSVALIIEEQIVDEQRVVTKGFFTPFKWGDATFEAMYFTTILTFNESGKIVKQVDWINYPGTLVDYAKRKNSNSWINQN